jgi:hypothetical protein
MGNPARIDPDEIEFDTERIEAVPGERRVLLLPPGTSLQCSHPAALDVTTLGDRAAVITSREVGTFQLQLCHGRRRWAVPIVVRADPEEPRPAWAAPAPSSFAAAKVSADRAAGAQSPAPPVPIRPWEKLLTAAAAADGAPSPGAEYGGPGVAASEPKFRALRTGPVSDDGVHPASVFAAGETAAGRVGDPAGVPMLPDDPPLVEPVDHAGPLRRPGQGLDAADPRPAPTEGTPRFTGVMRTTRGFVALLDGRPVGQGESTGPFRVERVDADRVLLARDGWVKELALSPR